MNQTTLSSDVSLQDGPSASDVDTLDPAAKTSNVALFLDFDGTLVELAETPEAIVVPPTLGSTLVRLREMLDGALAIVTGRSIAVIDRFLDPNLFDVAGIHGAEWRIGAHVEQINVEGDFKLKEAIVEVRERLARHPELLIEDKGGSLALHWRTAPTLAGLAISVIKETARRVGSGYRLQHGKSVAELLPVGVSKDRAIERFLSLPPYAGRYPIFMGDDLTDESGFQAINAHRGLSVRVGTGPTLARQRLATPVQVRRLLDSWALNGHINLNQDFPE